MYDALFPEVFCETHKFGAIIASEDLYIVVELSFDKSDELLKSVGNLSFIRE